MGIVATGQVTVVDQNDGKRGSLVAARAITGSAWSDTEAATAIFDVDGSTPANGDLVTLYNSSVSFSETRSYDGSIWTVRTQFFGGDVMINGTLPDSKFVIADRTNLITSPSFGDSAAWSNPSGIFSRIAAPSASWKRSHITQCDDPSGILRATANKVFDVTAGDIFYVSGQSQIINGSGFVTLQLQVSQTEDFAVITSLQIASTSLTSVTDISGFVTIPAEMRFARFRFLKGVGITSALMGSPVIRRATTSELLSDNAVNTNHMVEESSTLSRYFYDTTTRTISSSGSWVIIGTLKFTRFGVPSVFDLSATFDGFGNGMLILGLFRGSTQIASAGQFTSGGRMTQCSMNCVDTDEGVGATTYTLRAKRADPSTSAGWNATLRILRTYFSVKQFKR